MPDENEKPVEVEKKKKSAMYPLTDGLGSVLHALAFIILILGLILCVRTCQATRGMSLEQAACVWHDRDDCFKTK